MMQRSLPEGLRGGPRGQDATACRVSRQATVRVRRRGRSAGGCVEVEEVEEVVEEAVEEAVEVEEKEEGESTIQPT
ncbi:unnamed protein product [Arctogadus glacialis]